jgi:hypothetical protein
MTRGAADLAAHLTRPEPIAARNVATTTATTPR